VYARNVAIRDASLEDLPPMGADFGKKTFDICFAAGRGPGEGVVLLDGYDTE
jgi:hypothetical protein